VAAAQLKKHGTTKWYGRPHAFAHPPPLTYVLAPIQLQSCDADCGDCSGGDWGNSSILHIDLTSTRLRNLVAGAAPALIRVGGSGTFVHLEWFYSAEFPSSLYFHSLSFNRLSDVAHPLVPVCLWDELLGVCAWIVRWCGRALVWTGVDELVGRCWRISTYLWLKRTTGCGLERKPWRAATQY
jgi:hypothetical protein